MEGNFFEVLSNIQKYIVSDSQISEEEKEIINKSFSPIYLAQIYSCTNFDLMSFLRENYFINENYGTHFQITTTDVIEMLREYKRYKGHIRAPYFLKREKKLFDLNLDKKRLKDVYKALGDSELEIFLTEIDRLSEKEKECYFDYTEDEIRKISFEKKDDENFNEILKGKSKQNLDKNGNKKEIKIQEEKNKRDRMEKCNLLKLKPGEIICRNKIFASKCLPEKFYKKEWILIDICPDGEDFVFIFRNKDTLEKVIKRVSSENYNYYYILENVNSVSKSIAKAEDVICKKGPWYYSKEKDIIEKLKSSIIYDAERYDVGKAAVDYYFYAEEDESYIPKVFRFDIEHDISANGGIDLSAPYKVTYISAEYLDEYYIWILDSEKLNLNKEDIYLENNGDKRRLHIYEFANNESLMLQHFWYMLLKVLNPDIMTAWNNLKFDFPYLINRSKRLLYYTDSRFEFTKAINDPKFVIDIFNVLERKYYLGDLNRNFIEHRISGIIVADLMQMYFEQHQNSLESMTLDFVAELELGLRKKKMPSFDAPKEEWIRYNLWDTELLKLIDNKAQVTNFRFFFTKIAKNTWSKMGYALGIVEGLLNIYAKRNNIVLRNAVAEDIFEIKFMKEIPGGFTQTNNGGIFKYLVDYDAKSMYPSIIKSFNIGPNTLRLTVEPKAAYNLMLKNFQPEEKVKVYEDEMSIKDGRQYEAKEMTYQELYDLIKAKKYIITPSGAIFSSFEEETTIFYHILEELGNERDRIKGSMYDEKGILDVAKYNKQLALKIASNAFFGVFLYKGFMFFNTTLGASITMSARLLIKMLMLMIENYYQKKNLSLYDILKQIDVNGQQDLNNLKYVIYGDTDGCIITFQDIIKETDFNAAISKIEEELVKINGYIKNVVNEIYSYFNVDPKRGCIKFKEEWVASKGLFYKQKHKRYILHIIKEEGKRKDELLMRGVQLRRSDTPRIVKEEIEKVINYFLRQNEINVLELENKLKEIEENLIKLCKDKSLLLAKTVSFTKNLSEYKNNPQNINAMLFWNELHKREDFRVGTKGYLYNIISIDYDKVKKLYGLTEEEILEIKNKFKTNSIAIPQSYEKVPEYINLDINTIIEKRFRETYRSVFEPILEKVYEIEMPDFSFLL